MCRSIVVLMSCPVPTVSQLYFVVLVQVILYIRHPVAVIVCGGELILSRGNVFMNSALNDVSTTPRE